MSLLPTAPDISQWHGMAWRCLLHFPMALPSDWAYLHYPYPLLHFYLTIISQTPSLNAVTALENTQHPHSFAFVVYGPYV